jgi:hypothetical protein
MSDYRYILQKGGKKHNCPSCNKKTFVLYIDTETGNLLPEQYGRCDRESKCNYFSLPPLETLCYFVPIESIKVISEKAVLIAQNKIEQVLPKTAILEQAATGLYVADYFLNDKGNKRKKPLLISFNSNDKKYFQDNNTSFKPTATEPKPQPKNEPVFFDFETFKQTLQHYDKNTFINNLLYKVQFPFNADEITKVIQLYRLGTVADGYRAGAITFPYIDVNGNVRTIQVKQFDEQNHTTGTDFLHSMIEKEHKQSNTQLPKWIETYTQQDKRVTCLFGAHLLNKYPNNPVALVEAPKTAIYCTLYFGFPDVPKNFIWLAVYNKSSFSFDKLEVLKGREVFVFPDLSKDRATFNEWKNKASQYEKLLTGTRFKFSDLLEQLAPEKDKDKGKDIADYLIQQDWRLFREQKPKQLNTNNNEGINRITTAIKRTQQQIAILEEQEQQLIRECKNLENTFIQAAKGCSVKWYAPSYITEPHGANRLRELIYWTS